VNFKQLLASELNVGGFNLDERILNEYYSHGLWEFAGDLSVIVGLL